MHSSSMIRRFCCLQSTTTSPPSLGLSSKKKSLVLLGSPQVYYSLSCSLYIVITHQSLGFGIVIYFNLSNVQVSATVLDALLNASSAPDSLFEVLVQFSHFPFDSLLDNITKEYKHEVGLAYRLAIKPLGFAIT